MGKPKKKYIPPTTRLHPDLRRQGFLYRAGYGEVRRLDWDERGLWVCARAGILLWDVPEGTLLSRLWTPVLGAARDRQGRFYTAAWQIDRWDDQLASDKSWSPHRGRIEDLAVSPDGQLVVSLGEDGWLLVSDAEGQELRRLGLAAGTRRLRLDWPTKRAWTAGELEAEQWDLSSGVRLAQKNVMPALQLRDGDWSSDEEGLVLWQGQPVDFLEEGLADWCHDPSGRWLALASEHELVVVEKATGELLRAWDDFQEWPLCTAPSPDGRWVVSGGMDGQLSQRRLDSGELKQRWTAHTDAVTSLCFADQGRLLVSAGADGTICSWHWPSLELQRNMDGHDGAIHQLAVEGDRLFSAGSDGQVLVWDVQGGQVMAALTGYEGSVEELQIVQRGEVLLALYDDGSWASWDISRYGG
ncbi:MAG: hypothetical protein KF760_13105 [Candidatus Eremiobacteraeota bacterium]|nr:hypothetical protein [Candidatus Eremiobacteraeota bacterium]MCW5867005.1 hypothetical protein [Candidatus Eremiobacteraeota bacterium]